MLDLLNLFHMLLMLSSVPFFSVYFGLVIFYDLSWHSLDLYCCEHCLFSQPVETLSQIIYLSVLECSFYSFIDSGSQSKITCFHLSFPVFSLTFQLQLFSSPCLVTLTYGTFMGLLIFPLDYWLYFPASFHI